MTLAGSTVLAASTVKSVGVVIAVIVLIGVRRRTSSSTSAPAQAEVGSEIELAPNRKPYLRRRGARGPEARPHAHARAARPLSSSPSACRSTGWPSRAARTAPSRTSTSTFVNRGAAPVRHHRGGRVQLRRLPRRQEAAGGVAAYTSPTPTASSSTQVNWQAPALNTVLLRFSREEVRYILIYGRPVTPMPAWGVDGRRPAERPAAREPHRLPRERSSSRPRRRRSRSTDELARDARAEKNAGRHARVPDADQRRRGAVQPRATSDGFAGGAYSCARCHTKGWSYRDNDGATGERRARPAAAPAASDASPGSPAAILGQFLTETDRLRLHEGSEQGMLYGRNGQGTGRMPGFGADAGRGQRPARHRRGRRGRHRGQRPRHRSAARSTEDAGRGDRRLRAGPLTMTAYVDVLAGIAWDPGIRGILVVAGRRRSC